MEPLETPPLKRGRKPKPPEQVRIHRAGRVKQTTAKFLEGLGAGNFGRAVDFVVENYSKRLRKWKRPKLTPSVSR